MATGGRHFDGGPFQPPHALRTSGLTPLPGSRRGLRSPRSRRRKSMTRTVGFIGLGNMGGPMALNLVKAGFELVVHDINPARVAPLVAAGATVEASAEAVAAKCHRTICMVETTDQAESAILGEKGIIRSAKQGDIVLCMNTIDPLAARRFAERLGAKGVTMLDAPASGGTHGPATSTLPVIAAGLTTTFAPRKPLFPPQPR